MLIRTFFFLLFFSLNLSLNAFEEPFDQDDILGKAAEASGPPMDVKGSNSSSLTNLEAEPSSTIHNTVSVISGDYTEMFTDDVVPGPDPLHLQRVYSSGEHANGSLCIGWHLGKYGLLNRWKCDGKNDTKGYRATIVGGGGSRMTYREIDDCQYALHKKSYEKGLTNAATGLLSGRTNPLNDQLSSDKNKKTFTLRTGGGVVSVFDKSKDFFYLQKETKPNGLQLIYNYDSKHRVSSIVSKNKNGDKLAEANYLVSGKDSVSINVNNKQKVIYGMTKNDSKYFLNQVQTSSGTQKFIYKRIDKRIPQLLVKKGLPEGRCLEIEYFAKGDNPIPFGNVELFEEDDPRLFRVKALKAPVGHDATPQYIYKFVYNVHTQTHNEFKDNEYKEIIGGDTSVYNIYNHLVRYYYNRDHRLTTVDKHTGSGPNYELYSREKLFWQGPNLTNRIFHTKEGWPQYCKQYDYDKAGNVWRETLWGNLSGYNEKPILYPPSGFPEYNGCEFEFKLYTYSNDGLNLMTSMTEGKTAHTTFAYISGTDLLAKKLTGPIGSIKKREFFEYDVNGVLVKHIEDDGENEHRDNLQGVTERHIKIITPTSSIPIGMPAVIQHKYLDLATGCERLLKKVVQTFTSEGWLSKREVYDANDVLASTERWEHDAAGNATLYENPLGQIATKKYDANQNLVYEQGPDLSFHNEYTYDYANRPIKSEIIAQNGQRWIERSFYDLCSNKVASEDTYGNRTEYFYDEFGRVVKTRYPMVEVCC
jgi:hypothetical protein